MVERIALDTNVLVSGLQSNRGASFRLLQLIGTGRFELHISVAVVLEYEEVLKRLAPQLGLTHSDIDDVLDYICRVGIQHEIDFLWRPFLPDPDDDMLLELAVQAGCLFIVTHNVRDFINTGSLGIQAISPKKFLQKLGVLP